MKIQLPFLLLLLCVSRPALAAGISDYFPNCSPAPAQSAGRQLIVDPAARGQTGYRQILDAVRAAKPGDTITLMTGDYGSFSLSGGSANGFITIAAGPGQKARFTKISIGGNGTTSHWRLTGLTVTGPNHVNQGNLVLVTNSDNIILDHNNISSEEDQFNWRALDDKPTEWPSDGISARQSSCISVLENNLHNVYNGIDFGGDQAGLHGKFLLAANNKIDNFAADGIDHYGSHVRISGNRITNGHNLCNNKCIHNDGIQGWNYNRLPVVNSDIIIEGNSIIAQTQPGITLAADSLQGITIFDGKWDGVTVSNNLVITNTWHGISFYGVENGKIINNTVAPTNPAYKTWILIHLGKGDPPGKTYNDVSRNNAIAGNLRRGSPNPDAGNNLVLRWPDEFSQAFVKFDPEHFAYDMHPAKGSPLIAAGSAEGAPRTDIEGRERRNPVDIGAYAYIGK
jgi:parallel beta-helix repeat protein